MGADTARTAIVTGAAAPRSIGRACAVELLAAGWRVAVVDVLPFEVGDDPADDTSDVSAAGLLRSAQESGELTSVAGSAADGEVAQDAVRAVLDRYGRIDGLVNMAGIAAPTPFLDIAGRELEDVFTVNVVAVVRMCQAVIPSMVARGSGAIVNVSSVAALTGGGLFGGTHYAASKAAVEALTRGIAREFGPGGVRCNAVAPGFVETGITKGRLSSLQRDEIVARSLLGRAGERHEIARAVRFLLSGDASNVTGAVLDVNGGMYFRS